MLRTLIIVSAVCFAFAAQAQERSRAILVLDGSGSMWGQIDGVAKITIAQQVIGELLATLPPEQELGLTVYGHRRKGDCGDIETLILPQGDQRAAIQQAVNGIKPKGKTPLSAAVVAAAEALRYQEDKATVVLVSDGRETCDVDPCKVGETLEETGVDFTAHVIGFDVSDPADRAELQCLAERTGGTFRTASSASELGQALAVVAEPPAPEPGAGDAAGYCRGRRSGHLFRTQLECRRCRGCCRLADHRHRDTGSGTSSRSLFRVGDTSE